MPSGAGLMPGTLVRWPSATGCAKSTMVNVLIAISALRPEADERHTQLEGPGAEPLRAPPAPRENADRGGRELPDRGGPLTRELNFVIVSSLLIVKMHRDFHHILRMIVTSR